MPKTTNLGLNLTIDNTTTFENWRKSIDGENSIENGEELSNFQIIDEAIGNIDTLLTEVLGEGE